MYRSYKYCIALSWGSLSHDLQTPRKSRELEVADVLKKWHCHSFLTDKTFPFRHCSLLLQTIPHMTATSWVWREAMQVTSSLSFQDLSCSWQEDHVEPVTNCWLGILGDKLVLWCHAPTSNCTPPSRKQGSLSNLGSTLRSFRELWNTLMTNFKL